MKKLLRFGSLLLRRPGEAVSRLESLIDSRCEHLWNKRGHYVPADLKIVICELSAHLGTDLRPCFEEDALSFIEKEVAGRIRGLSAHAPAVTNNGDFALARLAYVVCRALRPERVLETGVCYGVSTSFLLQALHVNGRGELHSIDLPPLGNRADNSVGCLVPNELRDRWRLHRGTSRGLLARLLPEVEPLGLFIHDSLHTYHNMRRELRLVTPCLARPACVISDDVDFNTAFAEWSSEAQPVYSAVLRQERKTSLSGIALLAPGLAAGREGIHHDSRFRGPQREIA
jgi:predicted O-methyltransferase YrrM